MADFDYRDYFCDFCGSLLCMSNSTKNPHGSSSLSEPVKLLCLNCPFKNKRPAFKAMSWVPQRQILKPEIIRDSEQWANASTTTEQCPKCSHEKAYFLQVQTRSADEPMTNYYRCCKCAHNWSD